MKKIIEVKHLSKKYIIGKEKKMYNSLRDDLVNFFKNPISSFMGSSDFFYPLKNISFSIEKGETLGIIGSNGAGKSTLLKVLSRVTSISEGEVILRGRVGSLLEVGTGFHPELTGRENIYLNGSVMGLTRKEITDKFASIVEFSGTEKFLDTPIKHYSSGMFTRLAFSVAAHLDPDILIVDEVLSVGDMSFQKKAMERISNIGKEGKTVIFVSHNMESISKICKKVLWLEKGQIVDFGEASSVIAKYITAVRNASLVSKDLSDPSAYARDLGLGVFKFTQVSVTSKSRGKNIFFHKPFEVTVEGIASKNIDDFMVGITIGTVTGIPILNSYSIDGGLEKKYKKGKLTFTFTVDPNLLFPGSYIIHLVAVGAGISLWIPDALVFTVLEMGSSKTTRLKSEGIIYYPAKWHVN